MNKYLAIVPIRAGSQRVKNKNLRSFAGSSLLEMKLIELLKLRDVVDVVVNSDSEKAIKLAAEMGLLYHRREPFYASSACNNSELFQHLAETSPGEYQTLLYTPCTSPFITSDTIRQAIQLYESSSCDSVNSVNLKLSIICGLMGNP